MAFLDLKRHRAWNAITLRTVAIPRRIRLCWKKAIRKLAGVSNRIPEKKNPKTKKQTKNTPPQEQKKNEKPHKKKKQAPA